ncbi:MAG: ribonucleoside-diphosphate reductase subunit alpha [Microcystis sp. M38BS1]|uniref:class 1a ribonucleoside-diphosphate reductase subunit alpha n=1 Tax=Microcystis sp. M38BS1 TaxID=2771188 RepID=UPI0031FDCCF0|nr:ribonucleoside-diphosphate reductase subunit alpha [Microcystis sp. M38BS1]MCA6582524.1 ribonucleoside-diphosphate reductase subunit alpha [Pseudanabaena sp. M34BS1SP1A06MG]
MQVTKLDGSLQNLDYQKIHAMVEICATGIENVSVSDVIMGAKLNFYDGISTQDIQTALVKSAENLMTARNPNYSLLAGRLLLTQLRKQVWGQWEVPHLSDIVFANTLRGFYDDELQGFYSAEEWSKLNDYINHDRDLDYTSASIQQFKDKYSVKNRVTGQIYETPQIAYMLIAAAGFAHEDKAIRMQFVKDAYDAFSTETISLATPIRAGMRTKTKQYASCVLMAADDDLDSIAATQSAMMKYVTLRAGIGMDFGRWRALNAPIRNGEGKYTGAIGFLKAFEATLNSCSQGHIRKGSSTMFYPIWHKDVLSFLPLTNGKGTEETRTRGLDYGVCISKIFYERLQNGQDISLFDPNEVKAKYNLYENFGLESFDSLYLAAEADPTIEKTSISAVKLFTILAQERGETGQVYITNIDHFNTHGSFTVHISQSNLCEEIALPTRPFYSLDDPNGEIATCILACINPTKAKNWEYIQLARIVVRFLDNIIEYQEYPFVMAEKGSKGRRSIGVGFNDFAHWLAVNDLKWGTDEMLQKVHELTEMHQYYLLKASNELAIEKGACDLFSETKYAQGILPIDTYYKNVDALVEPDYNFKWEELRGYIKQYGLRNSTLSAQPPCESSSLTGSGSTNGIEPPRSAIGIKDSSTNTLKFAIPDVDKVEYEYAWGFSSNEAYLNTVAVIQKFFDQSISANTYYNPLLYPDSKVPLQVVLDDLIYAYSIGLKSLYYHNTHDMSDNGLSSSSCSSGACAL